ncbi:hypothetical protein X759_35885 [Mesorhizobium sp. LSHC420B00]|nr:hypothetical protein X759_35885 [Mesorhizobium sp. LSHC420B00]
MMSASGPLMATHWFSPPVYVKTDRPGVTYGCNNALEEARRAFEAAAREEGVSGQSG